MYYKGYALMPDVGVAPDLERGGWVIVDLATGTARSLTPKANEDGVVSHGFWSLDGLSGYPTDLLIDWVDQVALAPAVI